MAIKAIIFDCYGVLATEGWLALRDKYFGNNAKLYEETTSMTRLADEGLLNYEDYVAKIAGLSKIPVGDVRRVMETNAPNEPLLNYISDNLKPSYKLGLLSNSGANFLSRIFEPWQVSLFDEVVLSYQIGAAKPEPLMYTTIVEKLGVDPGECIFIDDQPRYLDGARDLGIKTVLFQNNTQTIADINKFLESENA